MKFNYHQKIKNYLREQIKVKWIEEGNETQSVNYFFS